MKHLCFVAKNILIHPSRAFRSIIEEKRVGECAWIVLIYLLLYCVLPRLNSNILENSVSIFTALASLLTTWLISAALTHGTAWLFNAKGKFSDLLIVKSYLYMCDILFFPIVCIGFLFLAIGSWFQILLILVIFSFFIWEFVLYIIAISECYRVSVKKAIGISVVSLIVLVVVVSLSVALLNIGGAVVGAFGA